MAKKAADITKALKLKAKPRPNALTFRVGVKKYTLPFEVRALNSDGYLFVHIPPAANILKIEGGKLTVVEDDTSAAEAQASFRESRKRGGRTRGATKSVELDPAIADALKKIPSGYKLVFDASGAPRLAKTRKRSK